MATDQPFPAIPPIPEDVPQVYVNFVLAQPTGMDITLAMGHQSGAEAPKWQVQVTMSWEEAKFVAQALMTQVEAYERDFGEVRDVMTAAEKVRTKIAASQEDGEPNA